MKAIRLDGFEATFAANPDPWNTFTARDEARKRSAILHALGPGPAGRLLELGCGNGSNSAALARRCLRLDAVDGAPSAVALTRHAIGRATGDNPRVRVRLLALPGRFPLDRYDAIVAAEILYYLSPPDLAATVAEIGHALRPGGRLILAHHHLRFADAATPPATIHDRVRGMLPFGTRRTANVRTERWHVESLMRRKS